MNYQLASASASTASASTFSWGNLAGWISLAVAIVSPVIVALITNRHQIKMLKSEIYAKRGLNVFEEYLTNLPKEIDSDAISDFYKKCYAKIFLYAPQSVWDEIDALDCLLKKEKHKTPEDKKNA